MYLVTEAVAALFDSNAPQVLRITGTDSNGNAITITDANVISGGFSIDRYSSSSNKLEIGTAISAELTLKIGNYNDAFSKYRFEGTELFVQIGVSDENDGITWIPCGYFTPDEQPRNRSIITLSALDRMMKFDAVPPTLTPWTTETGATMTDELGNVLYFCADLMFPATVRDLVEQTCARCGVTLATSIASLPNANYLIQEMPKLQQDVTFRNLIQWCAGLMGTNAFIDWNGRLRFSWYTNTGYNTTPDRRYSSDLYENDITISGVSYTTNDQQMYLAGTDAYALDLTGNAILAGADETNISSILQGIYNSVRGFTYRPFEAKVMPAPWLFPMDRVTFTDLEGNTHLSLLTNVNTTINGATVLKGAGETAQTNSYAAPSGLTNAQQVALRRVLAASNQFVDTAIDNATRQITGAENSHVKLVYDASGALSEILIMDTDDINTAVNVWRWNSGGLGHSSNGYNGTYSLAMTQDGSIVANMITTGTLNAALLKVGILQDAMGLNYWNMATGDFRLSGNSTVQINASQSVPLSNVANTITGVDVEYAKNQSTTVAPETGWRTTAPAWEDGYYIWQRTATTTPSGTTYSNPTCISGRDGQDGSSVTILGSYNTLAELQAAHPTGNTGDGYIVAGDLYVWNGSAWQDVGQIQGPQGPQGPQGQTGATGETGATGVGVSAVVEQYYLSTSSTTQTGGSWSTNQPQWVSGKYIWTRSRVTWTNGNVTTTDPVLAQAINGANSTASTANSTANSAYNTANAASAAVNNLDDSLNQQGVFNRLTNNGSAQGIYLQNGNLYINASYIGAGIIASANGGVTKFNLNTGEIISVGQPETGSTYESSTKILGGAIYIYTGTVGSQNQDLVATIYGGGSGSSLVIKPESGYTVEILSNTNISGDLETLGGTYIGGELYTKNPGDISYSAGYNGTITDAYGTTYNVINGIIMQ